MPSTYYGLVRQVGPYRMTAQDRAHVNEASPIVVGGGVWAGGTKHSGHGEWLEVQDIQGNQENGVVLGKPAPSAYHLPSVVVARSKDFMAMLSPKERRRYVNVPLRRPPPVGPETISPDTPDAVSPLTLRTERGMVVGDAVPTMPDLLASPISDVSMATAPETTATPTFTELAQEPLMESPLAAESVVVRTPPSELLLMPSMPAPLPVDQTEEQQAVQELAQLPAPAVPVTPAPTPAPRILEDEMYNNVRYVVAEPGAEIAPRQGPTVMWTPGQLEQYREIGLPVERTDSAVSEMERPAKRKGKAATAAKTKKAKKNVKETLAQAAKRKAFVKPLKEKQVTVKKPVLGTQEAGPSKTEEQKVQTKPSRKGKETAGVSKKASPALKKAGLRKKLDAVNRKLKTAQNRLKVLEGKQSGRTPSELKVLATQITKQKEKIAQLQKEKDLLLSELNKI